MNWKYLLGTPSSLVTRDQNRSDILLIFFVRSEMNDFHCGNTIEPSFLNSKITRFKESRLQNSRSPHQCYLRFKVENRRLKKWAAFRKFWLIIIHRARLDRSIKYCYDGETCSHNSSVFLVSSLICSLGVSLHDVVDLLQLVGQPLLAAELVLLQGDDQLLVVLHGVPEISEN